MLTGSGRTALASREAGVRYDGAGSDAVNRVVHLQDRECGEESASHGGSPHQIATHFFSAAARKSNNALVAGSSGRPRSALILLWVVSLAPKTVAETLASFSTLPRRCACALVSG